MVTLKEHREKGRIRIQRSRKKKKALGIRQVNADLSELARKTLEQNKNKTGETTSEIIERLILAHLEPLQRTPILKAKSGKSGPKK